jgi:MFS family permease
VSELGTQVSVLALPLIAVRTLRASTFDVAALSASSTLAFLLLGLPAGVIVDWLRRRPVMILADLGRLALIGSVPIAAAFGVLRLTQLFVVTLLVGMLSVLFDVAYQSILPSLVGRARLVEANSRLSATAESARVVGPGAAGLLVQAVGGAAAVTADALSFLVSALTLISIRSNEEVPASKGPKASIRREIAEGLSFVWSNSLLRAIAATTATANLFNGIQTAVEVVFLVRVLQTPASEIGALFALGGLGGVLAALSASPISRRIGGVRAAFAGIAVTSGGIAMPLATPGAGRLLFALGMLASSFGAVLYNVNQVSFRQRLCPDELLGRMNATMRFVVWGVLPVGGLIGGVLGTHLGTRTALLIAVLGQALAGLWLVLSPMRTLRDFPDLTQ